MDGRAFAIGRIDIRSFCSSQGVSVQAPRSGSHCRLPDRGVALPVHDAKPGAILTAARYRPRGESRTTPSRQVYVSSLGAIGQAGDVHGARHRLHLRRMAQAPCDRDGGVGNARCAAAATSSILALSSGNLSLPRKTPSKEAILEGRPANCNVVQTAIVEHAVAIDGRGGLHVDADALRDHCGIGNA